MLDDYEEGTWTASLGQYAGTPTIADANYTKIGRQVIANVNISLDGTSDTSSFQIQGLPFTARNLNNSVEGGFLIYNNSNLGQYYLLVSSNSTNAYLYNNGGGHFTYNDAGNNHNYRVCLIYTTDS